MFEFFCCFLFSCKIWDSQLGSQFVISLFKIHHTDFFFKKISFLSNHILNNEELAKRNKTKH